MTPTEQAADRVKALAEAKLAAPYEPGKMQSSAWYKATREFHEGITPEVLLDLLSALTALQARAEDAERENERLSARNLEVSTLAHGWMVAHDNRAAGLPVTYPSPADVPASLFVCALVAAAAERSYPQSTVDSILRAAFPLALTSERSQFLALLTPPLEQE